MKKIDFEGLKDTIGGFRLSLPEWIALGAVAAFVGYVTFFYFNSTQPLKNRLEDLKQREKSLQTQMRTEANKKQAVDEQRNNAEKIVDSLDGFESRLRSRKVGIPAIIDEVNQLAKENRVQAGDISFRTDAPVVLMEDTQPNASPKATPAATIQNRADKLVNVYEGLGIDTTVDGDYQDLRRFISALERSRNFVIINAISLQSVDEKAHSKFKSSAPKMPKLPPGVIQPGQPPPSGQPMPANIEGGALPDAGPTKILVSLKIEMETHFSRDERLEPNAKPVPANAPVASKP